MPKRKSPIVPQGGSAPQLSATGLKKKKKKAMTDAREGAADAESADLAVAAAAFEHMEPVDADAESVDSDDEDRVHDAADDDLRDLTGPGHEGLLSLVHSAGAAGADGHKIVAAADSPDKPESFFAWLVAPLPTKRFWGELHERRPFHISRPTARAYYDGWFGRSDVNALLEAGKLRYTEELDITRYENSVRSTHNGEGVATPEAVWDAFGRGCSVRLSWPQRHSDRVWAMVSMLEEYFGCGGGCNAYLTPAGCQGFAPHYDDVDALIVQLEGSKHWRLYSPRTVEEALPRFSSPNFAPGEVGEPVASVTLHAGDLLYLPRGYIHQAISGDADSMHLTLSTGRQHTWRDLLQLAFDGALDEMAASTPSMRRSLPRDVMQYMGVVHAPLADADVPADPRREAFVSTLGGMVSLFGKLSNPGLGWLPSPHTLLSLHPTAIPPIAHLGVAGGTRVRLTDACRRVALVPCAPPQLTAVTSDRRYD